VDAIVGELVTVIAHLSDPHLDRSSERVRRFRAVLAKIAALESVDAVLLTGDLADHGRTAEYEQLFAELPGALPWLTVPGNHDLSEPLLDGLSRAGRARTLNAILDVADVRLIGLDSHVDHVDGGHLADGTIAFAEQQISAAPGPVVLAMHHPPVRIGHAVMDSIALAHDDALAALIGRHPNVIAVLTGHLHRALATTFAGVALLGAPGIASTLRLGAGPELLLDTDAAPGFALHRVHEGRLQSTFHQLSPNGW
jgi:3',5'-cyclic AMP phosphodiesterase CpdA